MQASGLCWLSTTSNMLSSLHQIYFVGGVFVGSWRMAGLFLRLGPARSTLKQRPGISIAPIYFSLDFKITLTLMQTGENIKKWRTLFFFFFVVSWGGEPFNRNCPQPVRHSKESKQFTQSIQMWFISTCLFLSSCCLLCMSLFSLLLLFFFCWNETRDFYLFPPF